MMAFRRLMTQRGVQYLLGLLRANGVAVSAESFPTRIQVNIFFSQHGLTCSVHLEEGSTPWNSHDRP